MENNYNDKQVFRANKRNVEERLNGFIKIPIYWGVNNIGEGQYDIHVEHMKEEFERTVYGIETVLESINEKV
jgi:hypothetical protein